VTEEISPVVPLPLPSWRYKVRRAKEHLEALDHAVQWFTETGALKRRHEFQAEPPKYLFVVDSVSPIPLQIPLMVGDYVGNLRAALDHMWTAVLDHLDLPVTNRTQFPIFQREPKGKDGLRVWSQQIGGVPANIETIVKGLQPYKRGKDAVTHPLFYLNELVRRDKHRELSLMVVRSSGPVIHGSEMLVRPPLKRLEPGTVLHEIGQAEILASGMTDPNVAVNFYDMPEIGFETPAAVEGLEVVTTLRLVGLEVAKVLDTLAPFYEPQPPYRDWMKKGDVAPDV
jgi:hypothetical protein